MRCRFFFLAHFAAIRHDTTGSFSTSGIKRSWAFLLCLRGVFVWRSLSSSRTQHFGWGGETGYGRYSCSLLPVAFMWVGKQGTG